MRSLKLGISVMIALILGALVQAPATAAPEDDSGVSVTVEISEIDDDGSGDPSDPDEKPDPGGEEPGGEDETPDGDDQTGDDQDSSDLPDDSGAGQDELPRTGFSTGLALWIAFGFVVIGACVRSVFAARRNQPGHTL